MLGILLIVLILYQARKAFRPKKHKGGSRGCRKGFNPLSGEEGFQTRKIDLCHPSGQADVLILYQARKAFRLELDDAGETEVYAF